MNTTINPFANVNGNSPWNFFPNTPWNFSTPPSTPSFPVSWQNNGCSPVGGSPFFSQQFSPLSGCTPFGVSPQSFGQFPGGFWGTNWSGNFPQQTWQTNPWQQPVNGLGNTTPFFGQLSNPLFSTIPFSGFQPWSWNSGQNPGQWQSSPFPHTPNPSLFNLPFLGQPWNWTTPSGNWTNSPINGLPSWNNVFNGLPPFSLGGVSPFINSFPGVPFGQHIPFTTPGFMPGLTTGFNTGFIPGVPFGFSPSFFNTDAVNNTRQHNGAQQNPGQCNTTPNAPFGVQREAA